MTWSKPNRTKDSRIALALFNKAIKENALVIEQHFQQSNILLVSYYDGGFAFSFNTKKFEYHCGDLRVQWRPTTINLNVMNRLRRRSAELFIYQKLQYNLSGEYNEQHN